jgi:glycine cleavage system H protein
MELPAVGRQVQAGESFGEIESVKAVSDLYSPVEGQVVEVNEDLPDHLERLSTDPYGSGWIARIKLSDEASLRGLMNYSAYQKQCAEEH